MKYYVFSNCEELDKIVIVEGEKALLINKDPLSVNTIKYVGGDLFEFLGMEELGSFQLDLYVGNKILLPINHLYDEVDDLLKYENFKAIELNLSDIKNRDNYYISDFIRKEILKNEEKFK
ncbi:MAG: hypothetical protein E7H39_18215 [Clostridium sp.]|nr:hypothetical protein [Clostridium sp.]